VQPHSIYHNAAPVLVLGKMA